MDEVQGDDEDGEEDDIAKSGGKAILFFLTYHNSYQFFVSIASSF